MTKGPPQALDELVEYRHPDCLAVEYLRHSDETYTVFVLDLDYRYYVWVGTLSLDNRWTLSPVDVPWDHPGVGGQ